MKFADRLSGSFYKKIRFFVINLPRFIKKGFDFEARYKKNLGKFITKSSNFFVETTGQTIRKFNFLGIFNILSNTINMTQK